MIRITIDFESYWDAKCNIKKLGPSQYAKHPDYKTLSMAWQESKQSKPRAIYGHKNTQLFFDRLQRYPGKVALCAHNMYFDGFVAAYHFGYVPEFYLCTFSMAQALHSQYGPVDLETLAPLYGFPEGKIKGVLDELKGVSNPTPEQKRNLLKYNKEDTAICHSIATQMLEHYPKEELRVIDLSIRWFTQPHLVIDKDQCKKVIREEKNKKSDSVKKADTTPEVLRSNDKFAALLEERGFECPRKWSEKQKKYIPALAKADLGFVTLQKSKNPKLQALLEARTANKSSINETRAKALLERSNESFPIQLLYASAHTLRWGGGDKVNPQNLPRDGRLRQALRAPKGELLVIPDASQIEARMVAWMARQEELLAEFARPDGDPYAAFASEIYGRPINGIDNPDERFVGKTGILSLGFQSGAPKFRNTLAVGQFGPPVEISEQEAQRIVSTYRAKYYLIRQMWAELQSMIPYLMKQGEGREWRCLRFHHETIDLPNGLQLYYPNVKMVYNERYQSAEYTYHPWDRRYKKFLPKKLYGGQLTENIIQCLARIVTTQHMLQLAKYYRVVMMSHDEVVMSVPKAKAKACKRDAIEIMSQPPRWAEEVGLLPLAAECKISPYYIK